MLFTPSRLFILGCVMLSGLLTAIASPLMSVVSIRTERRLGRDVSARGPLKSRDGTDWSRLPLGTIENTHGYFHISLVINKKDVFHAYTCYTNEKEQEKHPLVVGTTTLKAKDVSKLKSLGTINVKNEKHFEQVSQALKSIPMTELPTKPGGNCVDYITLALDVLVNKGVLKEVPVVWTQQEPEYQEKAKVAWGVQ